MDKSKSSKKDQYNSMQWGKKSKGSKTKMLLWGSDSGEREAQLQLGGSSGMSLSCQEGCLAEGLAMATSNMDKSRGWKEQLRAFYLTLFQLQDFRLQKQGD